jgi:hypothetical protein
VTPDAMLARVARRALVISAVIAAASLVLGGLDAAAGAVGGAALAIMSFLLLRRGTTRAGDPARPGTAARLALTLLRYALLALAAYVMVAHVRLHPLGLMAGASSVVLAITIEAATHRRQEPS